VNFSNSSDKELVKYLEGGKAHAEGAFNEIYRRYSGQLHAYCLRILGNRELAEDIFQDTFIRFFKNVRSSSIDTNIPGFLIKIARNLCLNYKRDKRPTVEFDNFSVFSEANQNYEDTELLKLITMALDLLDNDYREAFILREYDELPYNEIAAICGISVANAKSRAYRAKMKIKEILAPYLADLYRKI
jgi:RNA polymerase sigma-70 factor (ECF subfamily)